MTNRPNISSLDHVAVHVNTLDTARSFYEEVLGLLPSAIDPAVASRGIVWYLLPDGRQIHLFATDNELPINRAHFALQVDDVPGWRRYLESHGIGIVKPSVDLYEIERFFIRDPSENLIEFVNWGQNAA